MGLLGRAAPAEHGHRGAAPGRRGADDRRPVRRGQGAPRRVLHRQGARPRRRARVGPQAGPGDDPPGRGAAVPGRAPSADTWHGRPRCSPRSNVCSARSTVGRWPSWSASSATSTSPRRRSRTRSPWPSERWPSSGLPPSPAGWIITTARNRAIDRLRREASREDRHAQAALLHAARRTGRAGRGGRRARRPAAPDLHLLPPGARRRRPGRADAPAPGRAHHRGDRARVPGARADHGPAAGPGQGQDPRREDPVPGPGRGRAAGPPAGRAGRRLPHLQRGLHGQRGRPARSARSSARRPSASGGSWPS